MLNVKNRSHAVTAQVTVPEGGASGVIIAQGGAFGGWSLYARDGRARVLPQLPRAAAVQGGAPAPRSRRVHHVVRMEFAYDGGGMGKGGTVTLYTDEQPGGRGAGRGHRAHHLLPR